MASGGSRLAPELERSMGSRTMGRFVGCEFPVGRFAGG